MKLKVLVFISIIVFIFPQLVNAIDEIQVIDNNLIYIRPGEDLEINFSYKSLDGNWKGIRVQKVSISPFELVFYDENEKITIDINKLNNIQLFFDANNFSGLDQLRKISDITQSFSYKYPLIFNSWVKIQDNIIGKMVEELFVIDDFLIIQKYDNILSIYPYQNVEAWDFRVISGTPAGYFKEFIVNINEKNYNLIDDAFYEGSKKLLDELMDGEIEFVDIPADPITLHYLVVGVVTAWNHKDEVFTEYVIVLKKETEKWYLKDLKKYVSTQL